jgi:spermidine/putrescine transport system substrate-binding protein
MSQKSSMDLDRRTLLGAGGAVALSAALDPRFAFAQNKVLDVLMPPSAVRKEALAMFEEQTGIKVRAAPYVSPTDNMGKLLSGARFDALITLSDLVKPSLAEAVKRKVILPFDVATVPNIDNLSPLFKRDLLVQDGKPYAVPIYWGFNPVLYNRKFIKDGDPLTDSYSLLLDDRYKGRVAIRDDAHESIHMVALCMGHKEPAAMDAKDIKEVTKFLISKKGNFRALWSKFAEAVQLMSSGEVHAMFGWLLMRTTLQKQGLDVVSNHPKEGLLWWVHAAFLPAAAERPNEGKQWVNFLISKEWGRKLTELSGVPSTSRVAKESFTPEQQKTYGYDTLDSGKPLVRLGSPVHMDLWLEAWSEFKAA